MGTYTVMWTALPNGITGPPTNRRIRLSVFASPQLRPTSVEGVLSEFDDFVDWAAHLQADHVSFAVEVDGVPGVIPATITSDRPESALWTALFQPSALVRSQAVEVEALTERAVSSYPAAKLLGHLKTGYQTIGDTSSVRLPAPAAVEAAFSLHDIFRAKRVARDDSDGDDGGGALSREARHARLSDDVFRLDGEGDLRANIARVRQEASALAREDPTRFIEVVRGNGTEESAFAQFAAFHERPPARATSTRPPMDFHDALGAFAEYPVLLRRLGLVIDLELPDTAIPRSPSTPPPGAPSTPARRLRVIPTFTPELSGEMITPFTAYVLEGDDVFVPARDPAPSDGRAPEAPFGLVEFHPNQYHLMQIDLDGVGHKVLNMIEGHVSGPTPGTAGAREDGEAIPSVRSSGIWIARADHARVLHSRLLAAMAHQRRLDTDRGTDRGASMVFFSDDLIRGYRVDVKDGGTDVKAVETRPWRSLHERHGVYTFTKATPAPIKVEIHDEGAAEPSLVQALPAADGTLPDHRELYLHESICHWQGWSLAAPRPGKAMTPDGPQVVVNTAPPDGFPLNVRFTTERNSLPRLRFKRLYQFRVRSVDLAGNSLTLAEATERQEDLTRQGRPAVIPAFMGEFRYRRFESVVSPVLVPRQRPNEGEGVERLVIRSDRTRSAADYAAHLTRLVRFRTMYRGIDDRHVVPPKTSLWMAEAHGLLEDAFGARPGETDEAFARRCAVVYRLGRKEKGELTDDAIIDVTTGEPVPIPPTPILDPETGATILRPSVEKIPTNPNPSPSALQGDGYVIHREPTLALPYLPDPLSRGATLCGLPGLPHGHEAIVNAAGATMRTGPSRLPPATIEALGSIAQISFGPDDTWPMKRPFRLEVIEDAGGRLQWDAAERVLRVPLAKAEQATIRLSSSLQEGDLDHLGMWQWTVDFANDHGLPLPNAGTILTAESGAFWMLSPFREITLVHAVPQPLDDPEIIFVQPRDTVGLTGQIEEVTALLDEGADLPVSVPFPAEVLTPDRGRTGALLMGEVRVHGKSTMKLDLQARWREPADLEEDEWPTAKANVCELPIHLPGAAPPPRDVPHDLLRLKPGTWYVPSRDVVQFSFARHEFGDTKHRRVTYAVVATSRFRDYFPTEVTNEPGGLVVASEETDVHIPSTTRPAAPQVRYIIPSFKWQRSVDPTTGVVTRVRVGGGLRVYLDRPWFSSGAGELLGVVVQRNPFDAVDSRLESYVTRWGCDPMWESNPTAVAPSIASFTNAISSRSDLTIDELDGPSHRVAIAGHAVHFDKTRDLWYSDIEIDSGPSYCPFVRLALARYQPHSIQGAHLSRIVIADFVQLVPTRTVTITPAPGSRDRFTITVEGLTYRTNAWHPGNREGIVQFDDLATPGAPAGIPMSGTINEGRDLVSVSVQERIRGTTDDVGWIDRPIPITITSAVDAGIPSEPGQPLWMGTVTLPTGRAPGQFRVVVQESEHYLTDDLRGFIRTTLDDPDLPPHHPPPDFFPDFCYPGAGRLVFADTFEL